MDYSIKIGGEAGQGIQTIGDALGRVFARSGYHVFSNQDYESRIRGGHFEFQPEPVDVEALIRSCCDLMRPQAGDTLIYDDVMCLIEPAPWRKLFPDLDEGEPEWRQRFHSS